MHSVPSLLLAVLVAAPAAPSGAQPPSTLHAEQAAPRTPSVARVMTMVRRAVGYGHVRALHHGFSVTEQAEADASGAQTLILGTRHGEVRKEDFGFDGTFRWQFDARRQMATPAPQRQFEKLVWPLWIRSHWWLNPRSGIEVRLDPSQSDSRTIALSLTLPDGLVPATLHVDRATWLPERLVVPYERGPFTMTLSEYRSWRGIRLPFAIATDYRGLSRRRVSTVEEIAGSDAFSPPALPADHHFDSAIPAALQTVAGAPLAAGVPGHHYVRATVDDRRAGWWHFDSGADGMMIDSAVADALGMPVIGRTRSIGADGNVREGTYRRGRSLTLGRLRIENPIFLALDLSANNAPPGERRAGVIGYDVFARSVVEYAQGGARIRLCRPQAYRLPEHARWQPLRHIDLTPAVDALVEGRIPGLFQVDTGAAGSVDLYAPFHTRHHLLEGRETREMRSIGAGGTFAVRTGRLGRFAFARREFRNVETTFRTGGIGREGGAGVIGRTLLAPFTTVFDYPNHRIAFVPLRSGEGICG